MLTVWGRANSINVQKVLWTLAELDLNYERIDAGMAFGGLDTDAYQARNPNRLIPTIDDNGFVLWESNVIVRYLSATYGAGTLCPTDAHARFHAESWMDWQATSIYPDLAPVFLGLIRNVAEFAAPETIAASVAKCERWLGILDAHLADRPFVNGDNFTMADIPVGATANRWYRLPVDREPHAHVEAWLNRLRERPAFAAHLDMPLS
ncbi:glutathione S-transferase family protein [Bauldia sp.]|uniref:glutathione S-transferase family protein n=1 Tax=Bauldia sp. TaxID=2575872 RepID=UPI003BA9DD5E